MAVFFTSDTHFGDRRTINVSRRPFADAAEMDTTMVANWNVVVEPGEMVWDLGDVARRPRDVPALSQRLHGVKHLIRGNNDPPATLRAGLACAITTNWSWTACGSC